MISTMTKRGELRIEKRKMTHEQYFDRLRDNYEQLYQQQMEINQRQQQMEINQRQVEFNEMHQAQMSYLESELERISFTIRQRTPLRSSPPPPPLSS